MNMIKFKDKDVSVKNKLSLMESIKFVNEVVVSVSDVEKNIYNPLFHDLSLLYNFLYFYTDLNVDSLTKIYEEMNEYENFKNQLLTSGAVDYEQYNMMVNAIEDELYVARERMIHKSEMDEMFKTLNSLLDTLNDKAKQLDIKSLEKVVKKLNMTELLKAFTRSGIGNESRDKAIQELSKENIELKKKVGAHNVLADK